VSPTVPIGVKLAVASPSNGTNGAVTSGVVARARSIVYILDPAPRSMTVIARRPSSLIMV
jgi:hypothetical protein